MATLSPFSHDSLSHEVNGDLDQAQPKSKESHDLVDRLESHYLHGKTAGRAWTGSTPSRNR